jgi:LysR family glycine cleavage system transcriptional activator
MRLPPMNTFRVFEAAARHQSFVKASQELCVTHGAVSRQVKQLESSLGVTLFERRNRAVFLTPQGRTLFAKCQQVLMDLSRAVQEVRVQDQTRRPLVLSCEPTIAIRWLVPRLHEFRSQYPDYEIHLLTAGGPVDFSRQQVDLALRRNDFQWGSQCYVEAVAAEKVGPVCTPEVWRRIRKGGAVRLLHSRTRPDAWAQWCKLSSHSVSRDGDEHYEHFYLSLQAASSGLGVAIASEFMVAADLQEGRLVAPFGFIPDGSEYVVLSPTPVEQDARRVALLAWFRSAMSRETR